jgi:biopolymer transport protein TolR
MSLGIKDQVEAAMSEINVVPLVDIVLVLLIIFMITAPMLSSSVEVNLPQTTSDAKESRERLVVTVTFKDENGDGSRDKRIFIQNRMVTFTDLEKRLKQYAEGTADRSVLLRADRDLDYGSILIVMSKIKKAGIEEVGLATEPLPD